MRAVGSMGGRMVTDDIPMEIGEINTCPAATSCYIMSTSTT